MVAVFGLLGTRKSDRYLVMQMASIGHFSDVEVDLFRAVLWRLPHVAITTAPPSRYIDFTDEHLCTPRQILGTGLILPTYPVLLFLNAFRAVAQFATRARRFLVRALDLQFPHPSGVPRRKPGS
ncbi:hypothetical protein C6361_25480 [Plantactinospora sp. BC1]|uniref:hypothetical protein n=1 Tax=Plantactinospora sp. BC1 TaxID=2108470 RepID=UPI000D175FC9|nr:hypothetical protein [Plantactinospora sp. BC1]AVT32252.1 hypothetical protein C6361_25480 [Plantactinospora sp. BC1]